MQERDSVPRGSPPETGAMHVYPGTPSLAYLSGYAYPDNTFFLNSARKRVQENASRPLGRQVFSSPQQFGSMQTAGFPNGVDDSRRIGMVPSSCVPFERPRGKSPIRQVVGANKKL